MLNHIPEHNRIGIYIPWKYLEIIVFYDFPSLGPCSNPTWSDLSRILVSFFSIPIYLSKDFLHGPVPPHGPWKILLPIWLEPCAKAWSAPFRQSQGAGPRPLWHRPFSSVLRLFRQFLWVNDRDYYGLLGDNGNIMVVQLEWLNGFCTRWSRVELHEIAKLDLSWFIE